MGADTVLGAIQFPHGLCGEQLRTLLGVDCIPVILWFGNIDRGFQAVEKSKADRAGTIVYRLVCVCDNVFAGRELFSVDDQHDHLCGDVGNNTNKRCQEKTPCGFRLNYGLQRI